MPFSVNVSDLSKQIPFSLTVKVKHVINLLYYFRVLSNVDFVLLNKYVPQKQGFQKQAFITEASFVLQKMVPFATLAYLKQLFLDLTRV